jgi:tetratricopeptide (TPR) repeat protein
MAAITSVYGRKSGLAFSLFCFLNAALSIFGTVRGLRAQEQSNGVVSGQVSALHDRPDHLLVRLLAQGDVPAAESFTDSNGNFGFYALPNGVYYVIVQAPGYRPVRQVVWVDQRISPRAQVFVSLERVSQEVSSPVHAIVGSAGSHELNANSPAREFDHRAVREFEKGNKNQKDGDLQAALLHYQRALQIAPDFYPALNNLGAMYLRQKDIAHAKDAFLKLLTINPDDAEPYINLGHALYQEGQYPLAIERLQEGLKHSPRSALGHFLLGCAYMKLEDLEKAEPNLKMAYSLDPAGMASARLQLANLYLRRRDVRAASVELESYLQANPRDPQAPAIKKMLASITAKRTN